MSMKTVDQEPEQEASSDTMLVARPLKPRRLSIATTASGDDESSRWATPNGSGYDDSIEAEMEGRRSVHPMAYRPAPPALLQPELFEAEKWGHWGGHPVPPSPHYMHTPTLTPKGHPGPFLSSGPPTPSGHVGDASQREHRPLPDDDLVMQGLSLLALLVSGPSIPNLPPCGCYGGLEVSSHISEALGVNEADAIKKAADGHGDKPVKVVIEHYPNIRVFADHTRPAKLPDPDGPGGSGGMAPQPGTPLNWQHGPPPSAGCPPHLVLPPPNVPPSPVGAAIPR